MASWSDGMISLKSLELKIGLHIQRTNMRCQTVQHKGVINHCSREKDTGVSSLSVPETTFNGNETES